MNTLSLIGRMAQARFDAMTAHKAKPVHSPAPAGLHQGSVVKISQVPLVLAQIGGALFPSDIKDSQQVLSVGSYPFNGMTVYRAYLSDGRSFIEAPVMPQQPNVALFTRLYTLQSEVIVSTPADKDFFIGAAATFETVVFQGDVTPFNPSGMMQQERMTEERIPALIGWPQFQLGTAESPILYDRVWSPWTTGVEPLPCDETIRDSSGGVTAVSHRMMQYARVAGTATEHLYADYLETSEGDVFSVYLGLDLEQSTLTILAAA